MTEAHRARAGTRGLAISRLRPLLTASTALTALAAAAPAHAQAPLATPIGGSVVAGSASIAQAPGATTITQSTARAAINWQSFNVGSRATVAFQQPNAQAVTLNRVIAPNPSAIAGRITANGSIVLVNPDGVVFANGAEVNAAGLVVSAPGITNRNFMAGRMVFNQPANPNARIVNNGSITIGQAGLAALVAPQVANSGVISAKLGSVVLAGARTATLDLYGDGLVSIDVQGAVRQVPVGPDGKPVKALVTNSGTIVAEGGTVLLTAKAVDGLIQNLVDAGGTISANGASGAAGGTVLVQGVGGSIRIAGTLMANGEGPGGTGGAIGLDATGRVTVANSARVDASGPAGGGLVAVGTTLARAKGGPGTTATLTAAHVLIAPGATISADATEAGNGGRVTVLSTVTTADHGAITAEGGSLGGNGGFVEVSGHNLALDGTVNTSAPLGAMGTILLDPYNLQIVASGTSDGDVGPTGVPYTAGDITPGSTDTVSASAIEALTGNVTLQAINNLEISANLELTAPNQSLLVEAGGNVTVDPGIIVSATGNIEMDAASSAPGLNVNPDASLVMDGVLSAGGNIMLIAGQGGMSLGDGTGADGSIAVNASTGSINLFSTGDLIQSSGVITAGTLTGTALGGASLPDNNSVANLGSFTVLTQFTFNDTAELTIVGPIAQDEEVFGSGVTVRAGDNVTVDSGVSISATGSVEIDASSATIPGHTTSGGLTMDGIITAGGNISLSAGTGGIFLGDFVVANDGNVTTNPSTGTLAVNTTGDFEQEAGTISAVTLSGSASFVDVESFGNAIGTLGAFTLVAADSSMFFSDTTNLTVTGPVSAPGGFVGISSNGDLTVAGPIDVPSMGNLFSGVDLSSGGNMVFSGEVNAAGGTVMLTATAGSITEPGGFIVAGTLTGSSGGAALFTGDNAIDTLAVIVSEDTGVNASADPPASPAFSAGGNFTLVDSTPLTITAPITVPNGDTIALVTDGLTEGSQIGESGVGTISGALQASLGVVSIEPFTASVPVALVGGGAQPAGTLSLDDALLAAITAGTLELTSFGSEPITVSGANQLGNLTDPNTGNPSGVNTLLVTAGGAFSEVAGASLNVGVLSGSAASVGLGGANVVGTLDQFASNSGFELTDTTGLTVLGTVSDPIGITLDVASSDGITLGNFVAGEGSLSSNPATGTVSLLTSGDIFQDSGTITAGTLTGSASFAFLDDANAISTLGFFTVVTDGELFLNDGINLTVAGPVSAIDGFVSLASTGNLSFSGEVNATGGTVAVTAGGSITEPGGAILANALNGTSGGAALFTGNNAIGTLASVSNSMASGPFDAFVAGGNFTLVDSSALTLAAPVSVPAGDTIALVTDSLIEGSQTIFTDTGSVTLFGALLAPGGEVSLEPFTASVPVALVGAGAQPAGTLSLDQALFDGITAGTLALTSFGGEPITISGANQLGNLTDPNTGQASGVGTLLVAAGGAFTEAAGASLNVGVLSGSAASVALGGANVISTLDQFSSTGGFELSDTTGLTVLGNLTDPTGITLTVAPGNLFFGNNLVTADVTTAGTLNVVVPDGAVAGGAGGESKITAGTLTGAALGLASFPTIDIATLGSFTVSGTNSQLTLTNGVPLTISGPVSAGLFAVNVAGALSETAGGALDVGALTGSASSVALNGSNLVSVLHGFTSASDFSLTDNEGLTVIGTLSAPDGITLDVAPGNLAVGQNGQAGLLTTADTMNLMVPDGSITVPNGSLVAGTLSGAAAGVATLGTADVATLGSFSVSGAAGELALTSTGPLTISGPVSAAFLDIAAPGTLTLSGTIFTTGLPLADQSGANPALPGSVLQVLSGGVFQEVGTSVIAPLGSGGATVRIQLPAAGGTTSFANLQAGAVNLVLALGPGQATGTTTLGGLLVIGTGGSANLFGSIAGIPGPAAASTARIEPAVNSNYLFNRCVIQTAFCGPTLVQVPQGTPNLVATGGEPALLPFVTLPPIVLLTIPAVVGESWTDAGGFPLPNIARLDF